MLFHTCSSCYSSNRNLHRSTALFVTPIACDYFEANGTDNPRWQRSLQLPLVPLRLSGEGHVFQFSLTNAYGTPANPPADIMCSLLLYYLLHLQSVIRHRNPLRSSAKKIREQKAQRSTFTRLFRSTLDWSKIPALSSFECYHQLQLNLFPSVLFAHRIAAH